MTLIVTILSCENHKISCEKKWTKKCFKTYSLSDPIDFMRQEVTIRVEVRILELAFANDFIRNFAFQIHETFEHVIIGFSIE